jgi:type II secretory pathway pseudopilin PulG
MHNKKGFTLVELLVAICLMILLFALAITSLLKAQSKSRDARRTADIAVIKVALEQYFNDHNFYPASLNFGQIFKDDAYGTYLKIVPNDPNINLSYCYTQISDYKYTLGADFENRAKECNP